MFGMGPPDETPKERMLYTQVGRLIMALKELQARHEELVALVTKIVEGDLPLDRVKIEDDTLIVKPEQEP